MTAIHHKQGSLFSAVALTQLAVSAALAGGWEVAPSFPVVDPSVGRLYAVGINDQGQLVAIGGMPFIGNDENGAVNVLAPPYTGAWMDGGMLEGVGPVIGQGGGIDNLGRIIVFGGWNPSDDNAPGETVAYDLADPNNTQGLAALPNGVPWMNIACASDDLNRVYSIGGGPGRTETAGDPNSDACVRYLGTTDSWEFIAPMPSPVADAAAVNDGHGHILVIGGYDEFGSRTTNVAQYDVATNTWSDTAVADLPAPTSGLAAIRGSNDLIYAMGGRQGAGNSVGAVVSDVYVLDLTTNVWSVGPSMALPREHFGVALGDDDYIYALGSGGATAAEQRQCEKIYTPVCPLISSPSSATVWKGMTLQLTAPVTGGAPLTYQWQKDGADLVDGPAAGGGVTSGAMTTTLVITLMDSPDAGEYRLLATNGCGTVEGDPVPVEVRIPPAIPTHWNASNLHPAWAQLSSTAHGVANGKIGGEATTPTLLPDGRILDLSHPVVWEAPDWTATDITPAGSIGGAVLAVGGDYLVGWFWHIYDCWVGGQMYTCGWKSAAYWTGAPLVFTEALHSSGPEYDAANDTDGTRIVGTLTYEYSEGNYTSNAYMWTPPNAGVSLHPSGASDSFANAVDGEHQYGSYQTAPPAPLVHAAMWSDTAASFLDMHPPGFSRSWITGAGDDQAVGTAYTTGDVPHAILWGAAPGTDVDLHPLSAGSSNAVDADGGLQVGNVDGRAAVWAGNADSFVDLSQWLPDGFMSGTANAIEVADDGVITIVGAGYNSVTGRGEAIVWQWTPSQPCPADFVSSATFQPPPDGVVNAADLAFLLGAWGANPGSPADIVSSDTFQPPPDGFVNAADLAYLLGAWGACE